MYQEERLFRRFMALSPSLRVNKKNILEYEKHFASTHKELPVYLYLSGGKGERINYILTGNRKMKALIEKRKFSGLQFDYQEIPWKGHHGQVAVSLRYILENKKY
jgi:predicted alpha/beta superfamily hydrolase